MLSINIIDRSHNGVKIKMTNYGTVCVFMFVYQNVCLLCLYAQIWL